MSASPALEALVKAIGERFGESLRSVLFYGAGLRDGDVDDDGLFDFIVVVDGYRRAYGGLRYAILNALLPPNVFYLEATNGERTVRCKYAVVSSRHLDRWTRPSCRQVWFWGRLAQPTVIAFAADEAARDEAVESLARSVRTFSEKAAPLVHDPFSPEEFWTIGLRASYRTELRAEKGGRSKAIVDTDPQRYARLTAAAAQELGWTRQSDGRYSADIGGFARWVGRRGWQFRRWQGKTLHLVRLMKATLTFKGGVDYILWKIERHSGVRVEVSDRARRHPVLAGWLAFWKIRRKGGFR